MIERVWSARTTREGAVKYADYFRRAVLPGSPLVHGESMRIVASPRRPETVLLAGCTASGRGNPFAPMVVVESED